VEAGLIQVRWQAAAQEDALVSGLPDPFLAGAFHSDRIEALPPKAVWLGASKTYAHQVFRIGERSWGLQFHPEVSPETFWTWVSRHDGDPADLDGIRHGGRHFEDQQQTVRAGTRALADRFSALLYETALQRSVA
jgi:GMP synthase (glutamine-hydrolysing)